MDAIRGALGAALGAAGMYFFDPRSGRRRRARIRDGFEHAAHTSLRGLDVATRDLWHRAHGLVAELRGAPRFAPDDDVLVERVRAKLGRVSSHPHPIEVACLGGRVRLHGLVLASEAARVVAGVRSVGGVTEVEDQLERVSSLQGGVRAWQRRALPRYWPPALRLLVGAGATSLLAYAALRRGFVGAAAAIAGGVTLARSVANVELASLVGARPRGITITKSIKIDAPIDDVFAYFTAFEKFPRFMRRVVEVAKAGDNRWHWKVRGPAGVAFEWDAIVMELVPGRFVSWTSTESASVRHTGSARFERASDGARMTIRLRYEPPIGAVGHEIAKLFGADPKRELDEDMLRFKSLLEQGKATGRDGPVTRDELRH
jgi:uncharacterized membrane protein